MTTPQIAQGLASLGRGGDSVLVHMQPHEVAGLQAIAKANGTSLTTNPHTGMPEAFSLGGFFSSLLPTVAGVLGAGFAPPGMSPMIMGMLAGAGTGALTNKKNPLEGALMGGLGGYGGANLFNLAKGFTPSVAAAQTVNTSATSPLQAAVNQSGGVMSNAVLDPNIAQQLQNQQISMFTPQGGSVQTAALGGPEASFGALTETTMPSLAQPAPDFSPIGGAVQGSGGYNPNVLSSAWDKVSANPMEFINQNKMAVGMPLGMAALSGIEPPTPGMTQEEYEAEQRRKFNKPLNLNEDTGLRLASGGVIAFDDGGSVPRASLNLKREEQQMAPMQMQAPQAAQITPAQQVDQPAQTELGIAALKPGAENEVKIDITSAQLNPMQQEAQQVQPLADRAQGEGIPALMQELGGQGVDFEKLYGRTQAPTPMGPSFAAPAPRGFGPDGRRLAAGGSIQTGGVMDLYQGTDSQPTFGGDQGYGLGRLSDLAGQQSLARAEQGSFAKGGTPRLEDGGFVVPADVVFYLGNHNTEAGQKRLAKMYGAHPIKGPGTGLSDSIPTSIEGKEPAKIANGEAYIPRKVVKAHGGPKKFYDMMAKVRKKATGSTKQAKSA